MRVVIDTNVLLSGLLWHGIPHTLIERVRAGALRLVSSPTLLTELADVLARPKFRAALTRANIDADEVLARVRLTAEIVDPPPCPYGSVVTPTMTPCWRSPSRPVPISLCRVTLICSFSALMAGFAL